MSPKDRVLVYKVPSLHYFRSTKQDGGFLSGAGVTSPVLQTRKPRLREEDLAQGSSPWGLGVPWGTDTGHTPARPSRDPEGGPGT